MSVVVRYYNNDGILIEFARFSIRRLEDVLPHIERHKPKDAVRVVIDIAF